MEADVAMLHEYYRRAFEEANPQWKRQESTVSSESVASTASVASTSSTASLSSTSLTSTSTTSSTTATSTTSTSSSTTSISSITYGSSTMSSAIQTTDSGGHIITTTVVVVPSVTPTESASNKSTNTGAIVGGVVGGIALIALIIIGGLLIRRKIKKDEFEANIFDPDRNVERPTSIGGGHPGNNFDLAGAGVGAAAAGAGAAAASNDRASHVTPYSYAPTSTGTGPASTYHGSSVAGAPEMSQAHSPVSSGYYSDYNYGNNAAYPNQYPNYNQYQAMPSIGVGESFPNPYGPGYQPATGYGGQAAAAAGFGAAAGANLGRNQTASSGYPVTSEGRSSPSASPPPGAAATLAPGAPLNPRAAKEREAFGGRSNYNVSNPNDATAARNPSPTPSRTSGQNPTSPVTVHQDGGRVPDEEEDQGEAEIPPTYDSIPRDAR